MSGDAELKELYGQLAVAACASYALMRIAQKKRSKNDFKAFREADEKVDAILARINAILG
jgi:hypothetical protein